MPQFRTKGRGANRKVYPIKRLKLSAADIAHRERFRYLHRAWEIKEKYKQDFENWSFSILGTTALRIDDRLEELTKTSLTNEQIIEALRKEFAQETSTSRKILSRIDDVSKKLQIPANKKFFVRDALESGWSEDQIRETWNIWSKLKIAGPGWDTVAMEGDRFDAVKTLHELGLSDSEIISIWKRFIELSTVVDLDFDELVDQLKSGVIRPGTGIRPGNIAWSKIVIPRD